MDARRMSVTDAPSPPDTVTAIIVSHDGARWLGETLDALLGQTRPVDRVVGVDTGSRDGGAELMRRVLGPNAVLSLPRRTGFGEAVAAVLDRLGPADGREWLWLLHDDCAPDPGALRALLRAAGDDPEIGVLGPKLLDWVDRRVLLEIGVTVDLAGRRDTGLDPREYDQGQHDADRDVLSVSTAGMLVRRDVWEEVGGLDPFLPLFRDDLDLCWRVWAAGYRVRNVAGALAWHAEAAARRLRRVGAGGGAAAGGGADGGGVREGVRGGFGDGIGRGGEGGRLRRLDRRNAVFVVMANLPPRSLPWALARNIAGSACRALLLLLGKRPAAALDEIAALGSVLARPARLAEARRARAAGRRRSHRAVARLLTPPGAGYRRVAEWLEGRLSGAGIPESAGRHAVTAPGEDGDELLADAGGMQRFLGNPGVLLFLALTAVTLVAERSLLGGSRLGGGALVPVIGGASDLWDLYTGGPRPAALGGDAWAPPYVAVLAAVSTVLLGKTWLAVWLLLLGCVPLAGVCAYVAARPFVPGRWARALPAACYALLPVATGAIAAGRLGTAVVFILLPACAALAVTVLTGERRRARRAAWALGLLLAVGTAFAPLLYPLALVLGALAALAFPRRGIAASVAIVSGVPVALLLPWLAGIAANPGRLLLEAGLHRPGLADPALPAGTLLALGPGGPGVPPAWVTCGLVAACVAVTAMRRDRPVAAIGWGVALFGLLVAILVSRTTVSSPDGDAGPAWPGVPLAFAATGMLTVAVLAARRAAGFLTANTGGTASRVGAASAMGAASAVGRARRATALAVVAAACSTPLLAAVAWVARGADGPISGNVPDAMPALAAVNSGDRDLTLLLRARGGGFTFTVLHRRTPLVGEADVPVPAEPRDRVAVAAAGLVSGRGGDDVRVLAAHGVRFVAVASPVDPRVSRALDSQPELARMSLSRRVGVWRVTLPVTPLPEAPDDPWHGPWLWVQAVMAAAVAVMAAPGSRDEPAPGGSRGDSRGDFRGGSRAGGEAVAR
ncbi:glycosyltransferase family 2 protein [Streptosporangium nondiastaticum]|uniref:glycosyltransferase family 2 protein n=1 Tax=Streptosporangium nondiastaticum TaxID=35764 RepID=UPI0031F94AFF